MSSPRHHSLLKRFAAMSLVALLAASGASGACSLSHNTRDVTQETRKIVDVAASAVQSTLDGATYEDLDPTAHPGGLARVRERMQFICDQLRARHLTVLEVPNTGTSTCLVAVTGAEGTASDGRSTSATQTEHERRAAAGVTDLEPIATGDGSEATLSWWYPIHVSGHEGNLVCRIDLDATRIQDRIRNSTLSFAIPMIAINALVVLAEVALLKRDVSDPLRELSGRMRSFVERGARDVEALEIGHDDEIREIADSYRQMTADICDYVARIETMTHERATAETELSVAQRIQLGLVPPTTELVGDRFKAFAFTHMAREVGGDFYDLSPLADGRVLFVLADVSGKGVSAALFMAMCRTLLHEKLCTLLDPAQALNEVNDIIEANNPENMFVTLEAGIFDPTSGLLTYANAGHTPPIIVGTGYASPEAGIPLGIFEDAGIVNETIRLAPGQGLLLYTDGATDAMGADGEFFGEDRLLAAVGAATSPEDAVLSVVDAIGSFTDDHEQFDDLTLLSLFAKET